MSKKGMIPKNKEEELAKDLLIQCHDWLKKELDVDTHLVLSRECNWGRNAFHAGCYFNDNREVRINFRNMYGNPIDQLIEVLGHEMRHAVQYKQDLLQRSQYDFVWKKRKGNRYVGGMWKNKTYSCIKYEDAPWEIDARKYQRKYADKVIKALGIKELVKTFVPYGTATSSNKIATYKILDDKYTRDGFIPLANSWMKDKSRKKESGLVYVVKSDLPEGFNIRNKEDNSWLYNKGQDLLQFIPWVKDVEQYGGFSIDELVS